jgi:hypothetical protein
LRAFGAAGSRSMVLGARSVCFSRHGCLVAAIAARLEGGRHIEANTSVCVLL